MGNKPPKLPVIIPVEEDEEGRMSSFSCVGYARIIHTRRSTVRSYGERWMEYIDRNGFGDISNCVTRYRAWRLAKQMVAKAEKDFPSCMNQNE